MDAGRSKAETFWTAFLRKLARRGVKRMISDAHGGLEAAAEVLGAAAQRCRVHFRKDALAKDGKNHRRVVSVPMDEAEGDVLADMTFPAAHRTRSHPTRPPERVKARSSAGPTSSASSPTRTPSDAILLEQGREWAVQRSGCMMLESVAPIGDDHAVSLPAPAA